MKDAILMVSVPELFSGFFFSSSRSGEADETENDSTAAVAGYSLQR
jgi:hypothetical protein